MQTLDPVGSPKVVLSFDFDGTLHDPSATPSVPPRLFEVLLRLRRDHHAIWGVNTGRSIEHVAEGLAEGGFPFRPDWVIAREREIYLTAGNGWLPHLEWNQRCEEEIHALFRESRELLDRIRDEVLDHTGAEWIEMDGDPAGLIARREEDMEWIMPRVEALTKEMPQLGWQRNSIWLRFGHRDFQKGSSLAEIARVFEVPAAQCFAIGDSHNDFEMLDPKNAGMIACPRNSVAEIRVHVDAHGGYLCDEAHGTGVVEALERFFPEG